MRFQEDTPPISEEHVSTWKIGADLGAKNKVIEEVLHFLNERIPITPSAMFKYRLCLDEAITNAITHGCKGRTDASVQVDLYWSRESWVLKVLDDGPGFDPCGVVDPTAPGRQFEEHGRGIMILKRYSDSVTYSKGGRELTVRVKCAEPVV